VRARDKKSLASTIPQKAHRLVYTLIAAGEDNDGIGFDRIRRSERRN
jgi:hypothetical protein